MRGPSIFSRPTIAGTSCCRGSTRLSRWGTSMSRSIKSSSRTRCFSRNMVAFEAAVVEAATRAVENSYYEDPYDLAAAYAVYIVQGHVFLDGNKRSAAFAACEFLRANGLAIKPS